MKTLSMKNFKAHEELEIPFNEKNFLIFGDNGAGKSSIYEALKIIFFKNNIETNIISEVADESEHIEAIREFWKQYNNAKTNIDFELLLNNNLFDRNFYQVFMFDINSLLITKSIYLQKLIESVYFDVDDSYLEKYLDVETKTNQILELLLADVSIEIEKEDMYCIKITDNSRNLINKKDIVKYFNEAKLNLVIIALLFSVVEIMKDGTKKTLIILDDFITSLDMVNRTFIMKYILPTFNGEDIQLLILTHNVYFYNLIIYLVNDIYKSTNKKWQYANLYEIDSSSELSLGLNEIKLSNIESQISENLNPLDIEIIGNQIRKKFEILLYELSKSLMIGAVEESDKIIKTIENKKICMFKDSKTGIDLLLDIEAILGENNSHNLANRIQHKIDDYKITDLNSIQKIIQELKIYRKVSMHSLSHGRIEQHSFSQKELIHSVKLLKVLESKIKTLDSSIQRRTDGM